MHSFPRLVPTALLLSVSLAALSCKKPPGETREEQYKAEAAAAAASEETGTLNQFRSEARRLYNGRKFAELEALAKELRDEKKRFVDGEWMIVDFYSSQDCRDDEPESMWQLHDKIHREWEQKFPDSITARVSRARFLTDYAWQARGSGYADKVTENGWKLFNERLAEARTTLDQSKHLKPTCPVWYSTMMRIALGQGWERNDYDALFKEAKALEPEFHSYDVSRAYFLLPRWHGEPGEWEAVAEKEIDLQGPTGPATYARVVNETARYYDNIFDETNVSWRKVRKGFDDLLVTYPDSKKLLNTYCRLACFAGDAPQAKKLFERIGKDKVPVSWRKGEFEKARKWAMSQK